MGRARFLVLVLSLAMTCAPRAEASVSVAVSLERLVTDSLLAGFFTPVEQTSVWEQDRIVTYTHCHVDEITAGEAKGEDLWIASLGGRVGGVAQWIDGEAIFTVGRPSFLFLRGDVAQKGEQAVAGIYVVTARGQGQYRVDVDAAQVKRFVPSVGAGLLVPPKTKFPAGPLAPQSTVPLPPLARDLLANRPVPEAVRDIRALWSRTHAK